MHVSLLAITLVVAAPALKDKPKADNDIVGEWVMESMTSGGRVRPNANPNPTPQRYIFTADGKWSVIRGELTLGDGIRGFFTDPKKNPPTIDLIMDVTEQEPTIRAGIYKIDGNILTLCLARDTERPTAFEAKARPRTTLYTFKRAKPKD
jgi:uncharacterized protein (TIGR03067 family)